MTLPHLAWRNATRRRNRYAPSFINLVGFTILCTVLWGGGDQAVRNLESKALIYYGGEGTLLTYRKGTGFWDDSARDPAETIKLLSAFPWVKGVGVRHVFRQPGTQVVFSHQSVPLRLVMGVDDEPGLKGRWDTVQPRKPLGPREILLPASAASRLRAQPGDQIVLSLRTYTGQRNTVLLTITGVTRDDPVFGRGVAFVDRRSLNAWSGKPAEYGSENTLWIDGPLSPDRAAFVESRLSQVWALWPVVTNKASFLVQYLEETWSGPKSALVALATHTRDVGQAIAALGIGLTAVIFLALTAAALGLNSTLRILLYERTRELGTLRALGMTRGRMAWFLRLEVLMVATVASVLGAATGALVLWLVSGVSWDDWALVQPLLIRGNLGFRFPWGPACGALILAMLASLAATRPLIHKVSHQPPVRAIEAPR